MSGTKETTHSSSDCDEEAQPLLHAHAPHTPRRRFQLSPSALSWLCCVAASVFIIGFVLVLVVVVGPAMNARECDGRITLTATQFTLDYQFWTFGTAYNVVFGENTNLQARFLSQVMVYPYVVDMEDAQGRLAAQIAQRYTGPFTGDVYDINLCGSKSDAIEGGSKYILREEYLAHILDSSYNLFTVSGTGAETHFAHVHYSWGLSTTITIRGVTGANSTLATLKRGTFRWNWEVDRTSGAISAPVVGLIGSMLGVLESSRSSSSSSSSSGSRG